MSRSGRYRFKFADREEEFSQIHALNYRTFVEEIPQHPTNEQGMLVDKFHDQNRYCIALREEQVVGMVAVRDHRPFSLDRKLENLDQYLPPCRSLCEVRLLAIASDHRRGKIVAGLFGMLGNYFHEGGYDLGLISGTTLQLRLYKSLGFTPFGPLVGTDEAAYQPMYITRAAFDTLRKKSRVVNEKSTQSSPTNGDRIVDNLLPGPVTLAPPVLAALGVAPFSHRSPAAMTMVCTIRERLTKMTGASECIIATGSGTLANDMVAAQLSLHEKPGVILSNGAFGERLIDHGRRHRLSFTPVIHPWGDPLDEGEVVAALDQLPAGGWLWMVHCETSTGEVFDIERYRRMTADRGLHLALDCVSSLGIEKVDLSRVFLASGSSGKGVGSSPGLALLFSNYAIASSDRLPRYLDAGLYLENDSVPFTVATNLIAALEVALERLDQPARKRCARHLSQTLTRRLETIGLGPMIHESRRSAAVVTLPLPPQVNAAKVGERFEQHGILVSYRSEYLLRRNWIQFVFMSPVREDVVDRIVRVIQELGRDKIS